ncbi:MAG TPA: hypothetical protein EYP08_01905 [Pyrodictiaceae archaeon]|nr:hypothetical protein [Pyrodictiaceae archaeon]
MLGCEGLIVVDRNLFEDNQAVMVVDDDGFYGGDLKFGECVNLDRRIGRCWHVYHPFRYALASR